LPEFNGGGGKNGHPTGHYTRHFNDLVTAARPVTLKKRYDAPQQEEPAAVGQIFPR